MWFRSRKGFFWLFPPPPSSSSSSSKLPTSGTLGKPGREKSKLRQIILFWGLVGREVSGLGDVLCSDTTRGKNSNRNQKPGGGERVLWEIDQIHVSEKLRVRRRCSPSLAVWNWNCMSSHGFRQLWWQVEKLTGRKNFSISSFSELCKKQSGARFIISI